ncbi:hypothetical protein BO79DRAFT_222375 [Aspergillus costaricaensis CBS 115574]|uniref:Uncharacterized protein n=1 Tax=Aspergillus costaricaensis CBS 115574 TaxID=1448317 RepID=A0ACD1HZ65_9EURO|nr:hypothetical protein BO79DRAFT_222375 [Aspergillus costaricaensis CBS 115574]RAK83595.1 hypothetical protein BO79DRAFT_222375 [Aspergillus costaricaensis CBS 115574]
MKSNQSYNIQVVKRKDNISPHAELSKEDKNVATVNFLSELWDIVAHDNQWRDEELKKSLMLFPTENIIMVKGEDWQIYIAIRVRQIVGAPPGTEDERLLCSREFVTKHINIILSLEENTAATYDPPNAGLSAADWVH